MSDALETARRIWLETVLTERSPISREFTSGRVAPAPSRHPDARMPLKLEDLRLAGDERFLAITKRFELTG